VCLGYGLYAELTYDEALKFIASKVAHLNEISDKLSEDALKVKTHIKVVLEVNDVHIMLLVEHQQRCFLILLF
jgi:prefoldin subunit 5